jgi:hypothetical protein
MMLECPHCHTSTLVHLTTPDYGYGYGAEFGCYACSTYGRRFTSHTEEAKQISDESRALSKANLEIYEALRLLACKHLIKWDGHYAPREEGMHFERPPRSFDLASAELRAAAQFSGLGLLSGLLSQELPNRTRRKQVRLRKLRNKVRRHTRLLQSRFRRGLGRTFTARIHLSYPTKAYILRQADLPPGVSPPGVAGVARGA